MCDCFKSSKFIYFMIAVIIISNIIILFWKIWWNRKLERFGGSSNEILQLKNDLESIDTQLGEYDDSIKNYIVNMGLKSIGDVELTEKEVELDDEVRENMKNKLSLRNNIQDNAYADITSDIQFNLSKLEDTTEELKETMEKL